MRMTLLALAGTLLIGLGSADAQITRPVEFTVDDPFYVGNTLMPAGTYVVAPTSRPDVSAIRGVSNRSSLFVMTMTTRYVGTPASSSVEFDKFGGALVLKTIVEEGEHDAATTFPSAVERREVAGSGSSSKVVAPAARISKKG